VSWQTFLEPRLSHDQRRRGLFVSLLHWHLLLTYITNSHESLGRIILSLGHRRTALALAGHRWVTLRLASFKRVYVTEGSESELVTFTGLGWLYNIKSWWDKSGNTVTVLTVTGLGFRAQYYCDKFSTVI